LSFEVRFDYRQTNLDPEFVVARLRIELDVGILAHVQSEGAADVINVVLMRNVI